MLSARGCHGAAQAAPFNTTTHSSQNRSRAPQLLPQEFRLLETSPGNRISCLLEMLTNAASRKEQEELFFSLAADMWQSCDQRCPDAVL